MQCKQAKHFASLQMKIYFVNVANAFSKLMDILFAVECQISKMIIVMQH